MNSPCLRDSVVRILPFAISAAALGFLPACPPPESPRDDPFLVGLSQRDVIHDGVVRQLRLFVPGQTLDAPPASVPLLLILHGGGGDAALMARITQFDALAQREGFIAAYPQGINGNWNDGRPELDNGVDDVGFIAAVIDELAAEYPVDQLRVYATGLSNGGQMCFRLAFDLGERIAAVAPVAALLSAALAEREPPPSMPMLIIFGRDDPITPFEGGTVGGDALSRGDVISADATRTFWIAANGAVAAPTVEDLPDRDPLDGTRATRAVHTTGGGAASAEFQFITVDGGGHTWPGGAQYLPVLAIGRTSRDFSASEEIWRFVSSVR
ncbi:Esterase PHB depolymerase [Phycisphaerae bacterium RAS1]|nr:Esterase PHB depolymerase [Phycisphaerae bacterium RAS1]